MAWCFNVVAGLLEDATGLAVPAYSGTGEGRDNPSLEAVPNVGPIPKGRYGIGEAHFSPHTGPISINLTPDGHDAHGRTNFRIHGDSENHDASHGCIVTDPKTRGAIRDSDDKILDVV